jgi:2-phospho-L-lactate guanylyltransferase
LGAQITPDLPGAGLNAALRHGAELIGAELIGPDRLDREDRRGVVIISSDLPAMDAADLDAALAGLPPQQRAFVADTDNRGTTLLAAPRGLTLDPAFGPGSRQRHRDSGAVELTGRPALRRDVDTPEDLAAACGLGVGPHTCAVLRTLGAAPVHLDGAR